LKRTFFCLYYSTNGRRSESSNVKREEDWFLDFLKIGFKVRANPVGVFMSELPKIRFIDAKRVSSVLGVSEKWVYKHQKRIPGYLKLEGKILFNEEVFFKELAKLSGQRLY